MKWVATIFALILALALAKAVLTLLGLALVLAVLCALIFRPWQTMVMAGEIGLFFLVLAYPWTAALTALVLVVGLAVSKRRPDQHAPARLASPPPE